MAVDLDEIDALLFDVGGVVIDIDFARASGQPDVLAHGMLNMAYLGRLLTRWFPQSAIRSYRVRFASISRVGDRIHCCGRVTGVAVESGLRRVSLELIARDQEGDVKLKGEAVVSLG